MAFSVDSAALTAIQSILDGARLQDPVLVMYESAVPGPEFDSLRDAVEDGIKTDRELSDLGGKIFQRVRRGLSPNLRIAARERADFEPDQLREVGGHTFVVGPLHELLLNGYQLTFLNDRFALVGGDGVEHTLSSLARLRGFDRT